jgi:hypothetical protein
MATCPNKTLQSWKDLVNSKGEDMAYYLWDKYEGNIPESEYAETAQVKPGVSELFESNPELANIGTPEQYSQYLDSIFPDSKVKDIVYHGSPNKEIQSFLSPEKEGYKKQETTTTGIAGIYFSNKKEVADLYQDFKKEGIKGKTYPAVINTKRPLVVGDKATDGFTEGTFGASALWNIQKGVLQGLKKAGIDSIKTGEYASKTSAVGENIEIAVFEPEQIHILGNEQDVEGFKEFVKSPEAKTTSPETDELSLYLSNKMNENFKISTPELKGAPSIDAIVTNHVPVNQTDIDTKKEEC